MLRLSTYLALHVALSAAIEGAFAWRFGHNPRSIAAHALLLAEWDLVLAGLSSMLAAFSAPASVWPHRTARTLVAATGTLQVYLYALNVVSNVAWGRNMTGHLVSAFGPTVLSGREPFPVGPLGIAAFAGGTLMLMLAAAARWSPAIEHDATNRPNVPPGARCARRTTGGWRSVAAATAVLLFSVTIAQGIAGRDNLFWKQELVAGFFRPEGFAFEPTARRHGRRRARRGAARGVSAAACRRLGASTSSSSSSTRCARTACRCTATSVPRRRFCRSWSSADDAEGGRRLLELFGIVLRHHQHARQPRVPRHQRPDLPAPGRAAGPGLPDVVRAVGQSPRVERPAVVLPRGRRRLFDGSQTRRYTMDDDRLVLEGLERVPPASRRISRPSSTCT